MYFTASQCKRVHKILVTQNFVDYGVVDYRIIVMNILWNYQHTIEFGLLL